MTSALGSPQMSLYGPNYTHAALYLGGDSDGTPLIAEAVTAAEASSFSQVRTLPLDLSTVYQGFPTSVAVFRLKQPLTNVQRATIVFWAHTTTARNLRYWDVLKDIIGPISLAWMDWDPIGHVPLIPSAFDDVMAQLHSNTQSTDKFTSSTLAWRAYLEGTAGAVDLSQPNNLRAASGSLLERFSDPVFLAKLSLSVIVPETFARSSQLRQVQ